jgi:preprotein translocase subunit Sec61beta
MSEENEPKRIKIDPEEIKRLLAIIYKARGIK